MINDHDEKDRWNGGSLRENVPLDVFLLVFIDGLIADIPGIGCGLAVVIVLVLGLVIVPVASFNDDTCGHVVVEDDRTAVVTHLHGDRREEE